MDGKKIMMSGIQPSGILTIGNYLGAIRNWKKLQQDFDCVYMLADLHTLTVRQDPAALRKNTMELIALYLACGLDPAQSAVFLQSHVPAHAELTWVLNMITYPGELTRMTQFKDKSLKHEDNINMALMDYPVLMAADILLYQSDLVPVGADQKQHLELARDLPGRKMSKSDENPNAFISMDDDRETVIRKFRRAVTDSDTRIVAAEDKPGISNLLTIYSLFANKTVKEAEREFEGKGYGEFKLAVGETVADALEPVRAEKNRLLADKGYLEGVLKEGAERAARMAYRTLGKVYKKVGLLPRARG